MRPLVLGAYGELDASHFDAVAFEQRRAIDFLSVHPSAVRAAQIFDVESIQSVDRKAAVEARHQRGIDDEVGPLGTAHCFVRTRHEAKEQGRVGVGRFQNPHSHSGGRRPRRTTPRRLR
jgi:hypothetical protein